MLDLIALMARKEALCEALEAYREQLAHFEVVRHPLVYSVPFIPGGEALLNAQLLAKMQDCEEALQAKQYDRYIWLHERPHRLDALTQLAPQLPHEQFWRLARGVYVDSENVHEERTRWVELFSSPRPQREALMHEEERVFLRDLDTSVEVWCGCLDADELDGVSVTLSRSVATWFAQRYARMHDAAAVVVGARVSRADVLAAILSRQERELLVLPQHVRERRIVLRVSPEHA